MYCRRGNRSPPQSQGAYQQQIWQMLPAGTQEGQAERDEAHEDNAHRIHAEQHGANIL